MAKTCNIILKKSTRLFNSLVLFLCVLTACQTNRSDKVRLIWSNGQAKGILVPTNLIDDINKHPLIITLNGGDRSLLGNFVNTDSGIVFQPLIPLTQGMEYGVLQSNRVVGKIIVETKSANAPQVLAIYPQADTVPENLLKLYIRFSEPMQTGDALNHVFLFDKKRDTLERIFLDLQPELWDPTDKILTLWIDPGRIKRDLVLNKELGNPLHNNETYELLVSGKWRNHRGISLGKDISKKIKVGPRSDSQPDINHWRFGTPEAGSKEPLIIYIGQPLDHFLLEESVRVYMGGKVVKGNIVVSDKDTIVKFTPDDEWQSGQYKLRVNARLEDLAGNNLNKVFDRDIYKQKKTDNAYYERLFELN